MSPKISLGVPVFNGETYLRSALDSLLAQTFLDFELIVSDNGSTDTTQEICEHYASLDARVRYVRQDRNRGASWNFNALFEMATGQYFKWAAHDDLCAPEYLEQCVAALDQDPRIVLAYPEMVDIDRGGHSIRLRKPIQWLDMASPSSRFRDLSLLHPSHTCEEIFGLIRSDVLKTTRLIGDYSDSDRTLLAELGLFGPFHEIPEVLFYHRLHPGSSVQVSPGRQERMAWFEPGKSGKLVFPHWRQFWDLMSVIWGGPISFNERMKCTFFMIRWLYRARIRLAGDIAWGIERAFQ